MNDTAARLLKLLSLLQTAREWTGPELAARLGVSVRTVRRDIERLRDLGYPVGSARGSAGGYRLTAGTAMPPLLLDDDEAVAMAVGLRTAAAGSVTGIADSSARALAKLEQVLPTRLRPRVRALHEATLPLTGEPALPAAERDAVAPDALVLIAGACRRGERLRFRYHAKRAAEPAERHVEPHRLVSDGRRWYLVAWDLDREDWRSFRLDRLTRPAATGARARPRPLPVADAAAFVSESIVSHRARHRALLTLHAPLERAAAALPAGTGELTPLGEDRCLLRTGGDALDWLACRIALLDVPWELHSPPELITFMRAMSERVARGVSPGRPRPRLPPG
ncbi:helix-turn-helix transcriptional regulator [Streptomyces johnsoniae]|uniref:WYL domain-containing protein n=1 Tax=Streptomyces johnsoniae TaxID=3075532 RepID=A0ABU2S8Q6_9ACTN|nr:WYL domain-containing protein [Streptomyces sp. DSM 41886]MDT0444799.1 WYL domain-containing protein [Streptomyces sp. DSM 41886]